jgi:integrase
MDDCDKYREWRVSGGYFAANGEQKARLARLKKGNRSVDLELTILGNVLHLAVRRRKLERNPIAGRSRYTSESEIRHCREVAPTPESLAQIERWLRARAEHTAADAILFMAYSGLRISEAMSKDWEDVDWAERVIHVKRLKKGIFPWVPILPAMATLLEGMKKRSASHLLFPSPFDPEKPRCAINNRITAACKALGLAHTTPHGLRSYFVTQARMAGIDENVIAKLIGDKTGAAIIARTYGDVRPDHLLKQAQRIKLTMAESSIESSHPSPGVAPCLTVFPGVAESTEAHG